MEIKIFKEIQLIQARNKLTFEKSYASLMPDDEKPLEVLPLKDLNQNTKW